MDDWMCPRCKTTKYRNPSLKLMVNVCGHALCESCVELLFSKGSGTCPDCNIPLRRSGFRVQLFEDPVVEKEVEIRKRVLRDYCKRESDFKTLLEYNDYLEELETVVFNLVHNIDVIETNKRIEQYKRDNKEQIAKTKSRANEDMAELNAILEEEKIRAERLRFESMSMEKQEKMRKLKNHEALIDDLMFSETDAKVIMASHKTAREKMELEPVKIEVPTAPTVPATNAPAFGIGFGIGRTSFLPVPKVEDVPLFVYEDEKVDLGGLLPPSTEQLKSTHSSYLNHIISAKPSEFAGGYHSSIACRRALQDAFADIALQPKIIHVINQVQPELPEPETEDQMDLS